MGGDAWVSQGVRRRSVVQKCIISILIRGDGRVIEAVKNIFDF